ncbi:hypothetical protein SAMN05421823_102600 [Catalinimonas alkaloidigena]|uniref:Uncharacterized protein n=1 Tax=Catalinimonas alkaloidigena TaxID=1075417 RepID=A0A1G9BFB5_9BACT|nr:hypothetical protein [Catalinimonas alkaloidigena]SDK38171.1 hypothetical protein SAMN05421823_102600 [Catalinimonas alkaloidigena]
MSLKAVGLLLLGRIAASSTPVPPYTATVQPAATFQYCTFVSCPDTPLVAAANVEPDTEPAYKPSFERANVLLRFLFSPSSILKRWIAEPAPQQAEQPITHELPLESMGEVIPSPSAV